ncbi:conserved hypothetical protein [delta proteobacterium NaphS2]|nr:conserved hypothetical protein [delta proteobacterium NaphS2]
MVAVGFFLKFVIFISIFVDNSAHKKHNSRFRKIYERM